MQIDLTWFRPLPKQLQFLRCKDRESVYAGGFGSGKTLAGGFRALRAAVDHPGTVGLVARQTYRALEDSTKKVIINGDDKPPIFPAELGHWHAGDDKFVLHNGSEVLFRSFQDTNEQKILGPNYGFIYVDELTEATERIWLALMSRLRHPAGPELAWGTTNPNGHDWVWQRFHRDGGNSQGPLFHAPSEENTYLSATYIEWLRSQPREWQKRYVDANFDTASGAIFSEWNRDIHVVDERVDALMGYDWRRFESLDHGSRAPTAYLQWIVDPDGNLVVWDEYVEEGWVTAHATAIAVKRQQWGNFQWGPVVSAPDVFAADSYGNTPAAEYARHGIRMIRADPSREAGFPRVGQYLMRRPDRLFPPWHPWAHTAGPDGLGAPLVYVHERCRTLAEQIPNYTWKDLSPSMEGRVNPPEEPRKLNDHTVDAFRFGLMSQPRPTASFAEMASYRVDEDDVPVSARELSAGVLTTNF